MRQLASVILLSLLIALSGCSAGTSKVLKKEPGGNVVHDSFKIKASGMYEECIELAPGMVFDYTFDASDFVNFNIHYHGEDKVHYPVAKKGVTMGKGTIQPEALPFYTPEQEFFCLMFDNINEEPVDVSFRCLLKDKHGGGMKGKGM